MRGVFGKRWVTVFAALLWASAAVLQGVAPAFPFFAGALVPEAKTSAQTPLQTEVQAAAIPVPENVPGNDGKYHGGTHRVATCHHHPQGCPASCLCPKTGFVGEEVSESPDGPKSGDARLTETAWVECSESRAVSEPASAVYLPEASREIVIRQVSRALRAPGPAFAPDVFDTPPAKIPIV